MVFDVNMDGICQMMIETALYIAVMHYGAWLLFLIITLLCNYSVTVSYAWRNKISCVGKNDMLFLKYVNIFADNVIYYIIDYSSFSIRFMTEDSRCDTFQLLK